MKTIIKDLYQQLGDRIDISGDDKKIIITAVTTFIADPASLECDIVEVHADGSVKILYDSLDPVMGDLWILRTLISVLQILEDQEY